jgi:predicted DNA-binding transcriptional regulator AlpA
MDHRLISEEELSNRWSIARKTLANWRTQKVGPAFIKLGGAVRYHLDEVERWEAAGNDARIGGRK